MKILITTGIFPPDIGGPARMVERKAGDLANKGNEVTVLTFGKMDRGKRNYLLVKAKSKLDFFLKILKLGKKVDMIYTFDLYTAGFFSWLVGKILLKKKLVVRFAGDSAWESAVNKGITNDDIVSFQEKNYGLTTWWKKKSRSLILQGADRVVAVSKFMKDLAVKIGVKAENIKVIYNSVDFFQAEIKRKEKKQKELNLGSQEKIIMTAGRLVPWKGIDGLISAISLLKQKEKLGKVKLVILGDGPDHERLKNLAKKEKLEKDVYFVGRVSLEEVFDYYNLADVFVLNSQYEGLSHILLEVLRLGKPIIASNCGGNPEVIENEKNGLLIEYNNIEQLVRSIERMLTEEKWQSEETKNQCKKSLQKFNWEANIRETLELFKELKNE